MVPRKRPVPHAVRGACVFLQELGCTRTDLVTALQKEWARESKNFQTQLIPRAIPVDDHASNGAAEAVVHRSSRERVKLPWRNLLESPSRQIPRFYRGWCDIRVFSETGFLCDRVAEHLLKS